MTVDPSPLPTGAVLSSARAPERAQLLLVDDVPSNLETLIAMLEDERDLCVATSGAQALELLGRGPRPELILLDAMMPGMDGYEVCARLKGDAALRDIPVIFVTARADAASESRALAAGAVDFIHKPVNKDVVRARVRLHLDLRRRTQALALSEARARAFMNAANDAVVVIDGEGRVVEFNGAAERMFGYTAGAITGQPLDTLMPPEVTLREHGHAAARPVLELLSQRTAAALELTARAKDGRLFPTEVTVGAIGSEASRMAVGIIRDISERRRAQQALAAARVREAEVAAAIQRRLLLRPPPESLRGFTVGCLTIPARIVGGDFYTFSRLGPGCFEVLVADAMGKGVPAALLAAAVKSAYRQVWFELMADSDWHSQPSPAEIVNALSAALAHQMVALESFITLSLLRFDHAARTVTWVNAGHNPTLLAGLDGRPPRELLGDNLPLGVLEGERYEERVTVFETGDVLLVYSDGVTEALNPRGEEFGVERLSRLLSLGCRGAAPAEAILDRIALAVRAHAEEGETRDDQTLVVVRIEER